MRASTWWPAVLILGAGAAGAQPIDVADSVLWVVSIVSFALSGFYSGSETAFIACDSVKMRHLSDRGNIRATRVLRLLDNPGHLLSVVLVGTNLANTACTTAVAALATIHFGDSGATIATIALVPLVLVFAEILPKGLFLAYANRMALVNVDAVRVSALLLYPLVKVFATMTDTVTRTLSSGAHGGGVRMTAEDVVFHIADSREGGLIAPETKALVDRALDLQEQRVRDVLVPLEKVVMLDADAPIDSYADMIAREGFSRFPLYRENRENVVGILSAHEYMTSTDPARMREEIKAGPRVTPDTPTTDVLLRMRERGRHMVIVEDRGRVVGMTTLEDILERFVGAIADEFH